MKYNLEETVHGMKIHVGRFLWGSHLLRFEETLNTLPSDNQLNWIGSLTERKTWRSIHCNVSLQVSGKCGQVLQGVVSAGWVNGLGGLRLCGREDVKWVCGRSHQIKRGERPRQDICGLYWLGEWPRVVGMHLNVWVSTITLFVRNEWEGFFWEWRMGKLRGLGMMDSWSEKVMNGWWSAREMVGNGGHRCLSPRIQKLSIPSPDALWPGEFLHVAYNGQSWQEFE